ncbi:Large ribosomal subunit protein eL28 [Caenorhabditis elegans]|uniref:Large ribosomal subunit protein eL28 n=1 Tax=Caenorhabditis elegans TaxID=6239 RepID=RL28_CAEEL|nr:Large ribosomal subunit protein eL28 [Caenorhabditis elegans]Q21930.3 RecName: Full=Large ribosomal subunit protein eL28; AltName: Full=60S ribosomal protein L28 [Caenorhabditis elegans]CAA99898.1 Large ribosomal subunit protein eL28 [Caenorhabditis elegans]|eukprot:NP_506180.1 60S ribosomal protein L28 [Caenorhabditis elegans]
MSDALVWQVIRNNSAFLRTQRGIGKRFSTEKFNLKKVNSPKYSGLANKHAIDVSAAAKGVVVSTKNEKGRPAKAVTTSTLSKTPVASVRRLAKNAGFNKFNKLAQRRAAAIVRSQVKKAKVQKTDA